MNLVARSTAKTRRIKKSTVFLKESQLRSICTKRKFSWTESLGAWTRHLKIAELLERRPDQANGL